MPRNIVVLSDGTGQIGGTGHDTNVYKLFRMLEDRTDDQIVFYDGGLGTDKQKIAGMAFGRGFGENLQQCYKFIFDNYKSGDKIFLFGFSRGAATVRSLASFIHYFGILPSSRPELIQQAYRIYANRKQEPPKPTVDDMRNRSFGGKVAGQTFNTIDKAAYRLSQIRKEDIQAKSEEFVRLHPNQWVTIEFLGVWDTVPDLGIVPFRGFDSLVDRLPSWKHRYHDFKLHPSVRNAYHALSIDDDRLWFFPTIWKECEPEKQKVEQVWFGGSHTDVGGGFWEAGFSDTALEWMVQKALQHGINLYLGSRKYWNFCVAPDATDKYHPAREGLGKIYAYGVRDKIWDQEAVDAFGPPRLHESVLERARRIPSYRPWIITEYPQLSEQYWATHPDRQRRQYIAESYVQYEDWCKKRRAEGQGSLPDVEAWRKLPGNSFEDWLEKNPVCIEEFDGKKFLVELHRPVQVDDQALRDYDRSSIIKLKEDVLNLLRLRAFKMQPEPRRRLFSRKTTMTEPEFEYRVELDKKRWKLEENETSKG